MSKNLYQAIRGFRDIYGDDVEVFSYIDRIMQKVVDSFGYKEIRLPLLEKTEVFSRGLGEVTDIVEKEMYTFTDRDETSLSMRPEGTAGCVRAGQEAGLLHNQISRLWYSGPMFRHERPQKGRYRQFYQFGVELFGLSGVEADIELISLSVKVFEELGLLDKLTLEINSLATSECRAAYREKLLDYFSNNEDKLSEYAKNRYKKNPLRILDSKDDTMQAVIKDAPKLLDSLDKDSKDYFDRACELLDKIGIKYKINDKLVRGLDYYSQLVFEWTTSELGSQATVCAGGRYDSLLKEFGARTEDATGLAFGVDRIAEIYKINQSDAYKKKSLDAYLIAVSKEAISEGIALVNKIRSLDLSLKMIANTDNASFKTHFKRANNSNARWAIIIGEQELEQGIVKLKHLNNKEILESAVAINNIEEIIEILKG